jgi:hypothetical protein
VTSRYLRVWSLALGLVVVGTACGAGSAGSVTPQRYVTAVCGAVLDWKTVVEVRSSALIGAEPSAQGSAAYFRALLQDTDTMIAGVRAAGPPSVPDGQELQTMVVQQLTTMGSGFARSAKDQALLGDPAAVVRQVELSVRGEVRSLHSELPQSSDAELSRAATSTFNCRQLFRKSPVGIGA